MSSSDESENEDDICRKFDEEANVIIQKETLPQKSGERYLLVYETYKKWRIENQKSLSTSEENNLVVYFTELKEKLKPPTLWSIWSMLKKTLNSKENCDISRFLNLKTLLKNNNKGYKPKQSLTLKWTDIERFINEAPDQVYLGTKVILIFGVCGGLRCEELTNVKIHDVKDEINRFIVAVYRTKTLHAQEFIVGELFYNTVKKYISLRPTETFTERFFIQYKEGKCLHQVIGINKIAEAPYVVATYLTLENAKGYTGHCFRRTAATLLSESGANMQLIKQMGGWRSDNVAQLYIEHSKTNRQKIFEGITHEAKLSTNRDSSTNITKSFETTSKPSISTACSEVISNKDALCTDPYELHWEDFSENFMVEELQQLTDTVKQNDFVTANGKILPEPTYVAKSSHKKLFSSHSPIKLDFIRHTEAPKKRKKNFTETQRAQEICNESITQSTFVNETYIFNNCKFNNCTFDSCSFLLKKSNDNN